MLRRSFFPMFLASAAFPAQAASRKIVTILGDSLTAGYGLATAQAFPAQLETILRRKISGLVVRPAGVSGDTSAGGLARVDFSVQADTSLCIVALGGNDLLQGVDPKVTAANLKAIVSSLKRRKIPVLLAGLKPPPVIGASYARDFARVFSDLARAQGLPLYPDLMAGVGPALRQRDGIHPTASGARIIASGLAPFVLKTLSR
ncbi:MAG: arylesterase [Alphaproteobacteria bacterium PA2]|nr:MAG: arylesterase [Alphaproteobacteria bacterium PA2]